MAKQWRVSSKFMGAGGYASGEVVNPDNVHPDHWAHWQKIGAVEEVDDADRAADEETAKTHGGDQAAIEHAQATKSELAPDSPALTTGQPGGAPLHTTAADTPGPAERMTGNPDGSEVGGDSTATDGGGSKAKK